MLFSIKKSKNKNNFIFPKIKKNFNWKTPAFYTDTKTIEDRINLLKKNIKKEWDGRYLIAYSLKTNYTIINLIKKNPELYIEIVSDQEYVMAKSEGFSDSKIIYNGPLKKNFFKLLNLPIIINLDNQSELKEIIKYKKNIKASIGLRLNSNLKNSRFGFNIENGEAQQIIDQLQKERIEIKGLHIHLGFFTSPKKYSQISKKIISLIKRNHFKLKYLDFGGGFPSHGEKPYGYKSKPYYPVKTYIKNICQPLKKFYNDNKKPILIFEPGRYIVDDSTVFIGKVIDVKINKNFQKIVINGTNNMLPSVWFRPQIVKTISLQKSEKQIKTIIYGSSCQEDDILYQGLLPNVKNNDLVIFYCVGAYNQNMNTNFIFSKPKSYFLNNNNENIK